MAKYDQPNPWRYFHMGLELAIAAVVFAGIGWLIDGRLGTTPWGILIGAGIGFTTGMYLFVKQAKQAMARSLDRSQKQSSHDEHD